MIARFWKPLLLLLCLVLSLGFFSYRHFKKTRAAQRKYLQHETWISLLDEKKFLSKLQQQPPAWMQEQIAEDFRDFEKGISKAQVDATFLQLKKNYPHPYYIRYRIINNELYRYFPVEEQISLSDNGTERALKTLLHYKRFKDLDFILVYEDGIPLPHMPEKFFHTPSKDLQAPLLISAKVKNTPYLVLIPDWRSVSDWWPRDLKTILAKDKPWHQKRAFALWRGTLTKNIRVKLCEISLQHPDVLDAKLNGVDDPALKNQLQDILGTRVPFEEFLDCKYLPITDGVMCASPALQWRLLSNSVTLKQESNEIQWFYKALKPYVHYIPVQNDLSDLIPQLHWAQSHDSLCQKIASQSTAFALNNLMLEDVYLYFSLVLDRYSSLQHSELQQETSQDPRWVNIHSRQALEKKACSQGMQGYLRSFSPF